LFALTLCASTPALFLTLFYSPAVLFPVGTKVINMSSKITLQDWSSFYNNSVFVSNKSCYERNASMRKT